MSNCDLKFTGERFIPAMQDKYEGMYEIIAEHMQRYGSVLDIVKGKKVLDAACGTGYGSALMATTAKEVTGIDISPEAIAYDQNLYKDIKNLSYVEASIAELPFEDNSFDVIISFETIEHVNEELQNSFIKEIKRCLKKDGLLVMSSPDKRTYSDLPNFDNEFHVKEFYFDEFKSFLEKEFKYNNFYLQGEHSFSAEVIREKTADSAKENFTVLNEFDYDNDKDLYIIAVSSNREIDKNIESISSLYQQKKIFNPYAYAYKNNQYAADSIISAKSFEDGDIKTAAFDIANVAAEGKLRFDPLEGEFCSCEIISIDTDIKDYQIAPCNVTAIDGRKYSFLNIDPIIEILGDYSNATYLTIQYRINILSALDIAQLLHIYQCKENEIKNTVIAERDNAITERNQVTAERNSAIAERNSAIAERNSAIAERDHFMAEKNRLTAELNTIYASRGYKALTKIRNIAHSLGLK